MSGKKGGCESEGVEYKNFGRRGLGNGKRNLTFYALEFEIASPIPLNKIAAETTFFQNFFFFFKKDAGGKRLPTLLEPPFIRASPDSGYRIRTK